MTLSIYGELAASELFSWTLLVKADRGAGLCIVNYGRSFLTVSSIFLSSFDISLFVLFTVESVMV